MQFPLSPQSLGFLFHPILATLRSASTFAFCSRNHSFRHLRTLL